MPTDRPTTLRITLAIAAMAVIVGLALRGYAALGDFWLDEIWSLIIAHQATSLLDLLHYKVDNNHLLNTMILRVMGDQAYWPLYRVPAIVAGGASILLAGLIAKRWSNAAAIVAMILLAVSHPLVHYGSEARGYSLAVMFMLGATLAMMSVAAPSPLSPAPSPRPSHNRRGSSLLSFWVCCVLGMMSHPLFVQAYLAMIGWSAARALSQRESKRWGHVLPLVSLHLPPLLVASLLYFAHWRGMEVAGGAIEGSWRIALQAAALTLGAPREPTALMVLAAALTLSAFIVSLRWLWQRDRAFAIFVALATLVVPAIMLLALRPAVLYERYFLLPIVLGLLSIAIWLGDLAHRSGAPRVAVVAAVTAFAALNLWRDSDLVQRGRGHYLEAMEFIAANTVGPEIVIGSDHEFRNRTVIEYYAGYIDKPVRYVPEAQWPGPDGHWFILHALDQRRQPLAQVTDRAGVRWELAAAFDASELSGFRWFVYRRVSP